MNDRIPTMNAPSTASPAGGLYAREIVSESKKALRTPEFAVPTLVLPLLFYALFGLVLPRPGSGTAGYLLATYGIFAALGPALFGFGAGVAFERDQGVLALKQLSPLPPAVYFVAKLATAGAFTLVVLLGLYALAATAGGVALPREAWLTMFVVHLASVPGFGLLGLCIGLRLGGSGAMAVTNVCFLLLAVVGGLWFPVYLFPDWLQAIALALPSHHYAELALAAIGRTAPGVGAVAVHVASILVFSAACAAFAWRAWTRVRG